MQALRKALLYDALPIPEGKADKTKLTLSKTLLNNPPHVPKGEKVRAFDPSKTGFFAEFRSSGVITFYLKYTDARGRRREFRIGRFGHITWDQACRKAKELLASITLGGDPAAERKGRRAVPSFKDFVNGSYLPFAKDRLRSFVNIEAMCRRKLVPEFGNMALDEVTPLYVQAFRRTLIAEGMSNAYVNRHLTLLRRIFACACEWGLLSGRNPGARPGLLPERHREMFLDHTQLRALLVALGHDRDMVAAAAIAFLALTGARRSEALGARWEFIDFERAQWTIPLSKSGRTRYVPLSPGALALLRRLPRDANPFVFVGRKPGTHLTEVRSAWARTKRAAGIPAEVRLHDLRHSFASTLINLGKPLEVIGKILGHSRIETTTRYAHLSQTNLLASATLVADVALGQDAG